VDAYESFSEIFKSPVAGLLCHYASSMRRCIIVVFTIGYWYVEEVNHRVELVCCKGSVENGGV
jgi:hypothetical protein